MKVVGIVVLAALLADGIWLSAVLLKLKGDWWTGMHQIEQG